MEEAWLDVIAKLYEQKLGLKTNWMKGSKRDKVLGYLNVLEEARKSIIETKDPKLEALYKQFYHGLFVIKKDEIPYSVYEAERDLAKSRGHGDFEINIIYMNQKSEEIIKGQEESLDKWLDYFLWDDEAIYYKPWEIYWVLEGLQKLGKYDNEKHQFSKRNKNTVYAYPAVDKAALLYSIELMRNYLKDKTYPDDIREALSQANFKKIYEYSLNYIHADKNQNLETEGIWIKYDQGSDYKKFWESLHGHNTGWCTETSEEVAKSQLKNGDFYVYYSKDENGLNTIPRIAIRMDGKKKIGEIRGIAKDQNLESNMAFVLEKKLEEFPDRDQYYKKESDMKKLSIIEDKTNNGEELSKEELRFLYEIDSSISGFGWDEDPRIEEIRSKRDIVKDAITIFDYDPSQVSSDINDLIKGKNILCFCGDIDLSYLYAITGRISQISSLERVIGGIHGDTFGTNELEIENITFPKYTNELIIYGVKKIMNTTFPEVIHGDFSLNMSQEVTNCILPKKVYGYCNMSTIRNAKDMVFPEFVEATVDVMNLQKAENVILPKYVGKDLGINFLSEPNNVQLPEFIGGKLICTTPTNIEGFIVPSNFQYGNYLTIELKEENLRNRVEQEQLSSAKK